MLNTAAQQNRSASKNRYKILIPFDATKKDTKDIKIIIFLDKFK